jgi:hypothetical protein
MADRIAATATAAEYFMVILLCVEQLTERGIARNLPKSSVY